MKNYIGIDLGTTNSAICSYDSTGTRIWKSPEQNDVTPSVIYIDRRGNKYVGKRAYDTAPHSPDNSAMLFKRLMGTSTPIQLPALNLTMTPEECSAEILRVLFGYLPEEIRNDPELGTVITVPAAFNQMQKNATMQAAEMAEVGRVALMQEPVAAVMSVMRARQGDSTFLVYDLGGGTLDIALAESVGGHVNLMAHGGIAMCGGRDFDRVIVDNVVKPWLVENFNLPKDLPTNPTYKSLLRLAAWAAERAKIELSARDDAIIGLSETETRVRDLSGKEIYFDVPLSRATFDALIEERLRESIGAAREALSKSGLSPHDVERIVFVGGPTNYKPLRDKVAFELGIPASTEVNPMTAVAEGAAVFAESIDWSTQSRARKSNRGRLASSDKLDIAFSYTARTPDSRAKIVLQIGGQALPGAEYQIDSPDTGWTSGRLPLKTGSSVDVLLANNGENAFKVFVFDATGGPVQLGENRIVITRSAATVDAIPASHSIGIEVLQKLGGAATIEWLVRAGDQLPKKGTCKFRAAESLKAGSAGALNFKLLEGQSEDPADNRFIGLLKIAGSDFNDGVIPAGAELLCEFEMLDSGNIVLEVSVPSISGTFHSGKNFYSRQEGQFDFASDAARVVEEGNKTLERLDGINKVVEDDPELDRARNKLEAASNLDGAELDVERTQQAMENVLEARKILARVRQDHLKQIRQMELEGAVKFFDEVVRQFARPSEESAFDSLAKTAARSVERNDRDFESHLSELKGKNFEILWRQDWFIVERFKWMVSSPHRFADAGKFKELATAGLGFMQADDMDSLRRVVGALSQIQIDLGNDTSMAEIVNIVRE
jgi:molecular chaperone DnaK